MPKFVVQDKQFLWDTRLERYFKHYRIQDAVWCCGMSAQIMLLVYSMGQNLFTFGAPDSWSFIYSWWAEDIIYKEDTLCDYRHNFF